MKKNRAARAGHWRVGVVADLDQPTVRKIVVPHFLFLEPGRRLGRIGNGDESIVIGTLHVIDPGVGGRDLVKREISTGRKRGVVSVDFSDLKNSRRGAAVAFGFAETIFILTRDAAAPGSAAFCEQDRL